MRFKLSVAVAFLLIILTALEASAQQNKLTQTANADANNRQVAIEKVHLHFDKPFYYSGDTIWFKSYLVDQENKLTEHSKLLYVDLIDKTDRVLKSIKVPLSAGLGWADIPLDKHLAGGNYRVRAYTAWMRNFGEEFFFDKVIQVTDIFEKQIISSIQYSNKGAQLAADLEYKSPDGNSISGKEIKYNIVTPGKKDISGTTVTDAAGRIQLLLDTARLTQSILSTDLKTEVDTFSRAFILPGKVSDFDAQFFPEGGVLVNNIPSKLGFKIVGANGLGIKASGYITDDTNSRIASFDTEFSGMGVLALNPQSGKTYKAHVTTESSITKSVSLPLAIDQGYVMTVTEDENNILVKVRVSDDLRGKHITLKAVSQGKEFVNSSNLIKESQLIIKILKADLPSGIARLSISTPEGNPAAERLVFIDNSDQLTIRVDSLREHYVSRSKITPKIMVSDKSGKPVLAHMSITVIDEGKVPYDDRDETTILSNLLLSSELKGYIEKPNFYFTNKNADKKRQLDILMLTQGWRKFDLRQITADRGMNTTFEAESGLTVKGKVLSPLNAPISGAEVSLVIQGKDPIFRKTNTNEKGEFAFDTLYYENIARLAFSAKNSKGSPNVNIVLDSVLAQKVSKFDLHHAADLTTLEDLIVSNLDQENIDYLKKYADLSKTQLLSEVVVRATRTRAVPNSANLNRRDAMYTFLEKDLQNYTRLSDLVTAKVPGIKTLRNKAGEIAATMGRKEYSSVGGPVYMQVYLDGVPMGLDLDQYNLNDLDAVEVLNRDIDFAVYGTLGSGGVILLTSRTSGPKAKQPMGTIRLNSPGYVAERQFYSPLYDNPNLNTQTRDQRSTIYWNPNLLISNGVNTDASFYTADKAGTYRFIIEGIDEFGRIGRTVLTRNVGLQAAQVFAKSNPAAKKPEISPSATPKQLIEKVHLHFDRPFYSAGDTMWFKAYLVEAGTGLTKNSGVLYVDLLSDSDEIIESIKVPLSAGLGWAHFDLSENLPGGNYRVRAYTNWMRNFGDEAFFNKIIPVSDIFESQIAASVKYNYSGQQFIADLEYKDMEGKPLINKDVKYTVPRGDKRTISGKGVTDDKGHLQIKIDTADLGNARHIQAGLKIEKDTLFKNFEIPVNILGFDAQFFPEGGELVNNIPSKVGFKITGPSGLGLNGSGYVADEANAKVAEFKTEFAGMGVFNLNPQLGKVYTAYVRLENGVEKAISLPKTLAQGMVLTISQDEKNIIADVTASSGFAAGANIRLIASSQGNIVFDSKNLSAGQSGIKIAKADLPAGVVRISLMKNSQPIAERIVFVDQPEKLLINFDSLQNAYTTTSRVVPGISSATSLGRPATAHFSMAVIDDDKVPQDESDEMTIFSNLLLSSELKGYIEKPNYYFTDTDDEKKRHLDILMLTQGWRKFERLKSSFEPETGLTVKGKLLSPLKAPVPNAPVRLVLQREGEGFKNSLSNADGEFTFDSLYFKNRVKMILSASSNSGKGNVAIKIDSVSGTPAALPSNHYRPNFLAIIDSIIIAGKDDTYSEQMNYRINLNKVQQLAEVKVVATRKKAHHYQLLSPAAYTLDSKVLSKYSNLPLAIVSEGVPRVRMDILGIPRFFGRGGWREMAIWLDDVQIDDFEFNSIDPANIEALEIVLSTVFTRDGKPAEGALFITSRKGGPVSKSPELGQFVYFAQGFQPERQFYSPRYDNPKTTPVSDLRTTIYWNPDILTVNGKSQAIDFFTGAKPGKYRFIIEGIDSEGRLGRKVILKEIK